MKSRMSNKTKKRLKWSEGEGKYYHPWIITSELNSSGTTSIIKDWKTGRQVHCLSQGEALWYYILRWDDNNVEIREQFPLNTEDTVYIAKANGFKHPHICDLALFRQVGNCTHFFALTGVLFSD